jgi:hypothetical protein
VGAFGIVTQDRNENALAKRHACHINRGKRSASKIGLRRAVFGGFAALTLGFVTLRSIAPGA